MTAERGPNKTRFPHILTSLTGIHYVIIELNKRQPSASGNSRQAQAAGSTLTS